MVHALILSVKWGVGEDCGRGGWEVAGYLCGRRGHVAQR